MSSCLLPQFKCQPDSFSTHFRTQQHHAKNRKPIYFRAQCILSTTSPPASTSAAVLDLENLRLPSLEAHSDSVTTNRPWAYMGAVGTPKEATFGVSFSTETLITSDEVIAAAAAQAVTLARAAVKAAKDALLMVNNYNSMNTESKLVIPSTADAATSRWPRLTEAEQAHIFGDTMADESGPTEEFSIQDPIKEYDYSEPNIEELALLEKQFSEGITARSTRQKERKARRARAAKNAAANAVSVKSGSTSKKKCGSLQDVDYSDPLYFFRRTTSSHKLLTASEEIVLSKGIQDLLKLERLQEELVERCGGQPTFAQWAAAAGVDQKTLRKRLNYGLGCKEKMIKCNIRLVISISKSYQGSGLSVQDLIQEGCRGLVRGAEKFDPSKGFKFSTYAHWWIKQAIRKSLTEHARIIRMPFHLVDANYKVKEAKNQFFMDHGRVPEDEEIAKATGFSMKRLTTLRLNSKVPISIDQKIGNDKNVKISEILADPNSETGEREIMKLYLKHDLGKVLATLSPKENLVIKLRFGLDDGRIRSLQEVGAIMGVSRERIRQIESTAVSKLKHKKRSTKLRPYLYR